MAFTFIPRSVTNSPLLNTRKRLRSVTPSDAGKSANGNSENDFLRSPLAKRKKIAAERTGHSALKQGISANELAKPETMVSNEPETRKADAQNMDEDDDRSSSDEEDDSDEDDSDEDESEEDDDFLARALEEDAG